MRTKVVTKLGANVVGRVVPYVSWGVTAWDIGRVLGKKYGGAWVRQYRESQKK